MLEIEKYTITQKVERKRMEVGNCKLGNEVMILVMKILIHLALVRKIYNPCGQ